MASDPKNSKDGKASKAKHVAIRELDAFEESITLSQVLGQTQAASYLSQLVEEIQYNAYTKSGTKLPTVLLVGGASRRLLSRAFCNDIGFPNYEEFYTQNLSRMVGYSGTVFTPSVQETLFHLRFEEGFPTTAIFEELGGLVRDGYLMVDNDTILRKYNKLFVFSAETEEACDKHLLEHIDHIIPVNSIISHDELGAILRQRLDFSRLSYDANAPAKIASRCGTTGTAMQTLKIAVMMTRATCGSHISLETAEKAINIWLQRTANKLTRASRKDASQFPPAQ